MSKFTTESNVYSCEARESFLGDTKTYREALVNWLCVFCDKLYNSILHQQLVVFWYRKRPSQLS